jgi:bacillolysin
MTSLARIAGWTGVSLFGLWVSAPSAQQVGAEPQRVRVTSSVSQVTSDADRQALTAWDLTVTEWVGSGRLVTVARQPDVFVPGRTVERFDELYRGVPVFGGGLTRQIDETGSAVSILGTVHPDIDIDAAPRLGSSLAAQLLSTAGGGELLAGEGLQLVVLPTAAGYRLAWTARVASRADGHERRVFIDGSTGAHVLTYDDTWTQVQTEGHVGVGTGTVGERLKLSVDKSSAGYLAIDRLRRTNTSTYDMGGDPYRTRDVQSGATQAGTSEIARDADNVWTDRAVSSAHAYTGLTLDYLRLVQRFALDGASSPISVFVNLARPEDYAALSGDFPLYFNNAFYSNRRLFFGVGNVSSNRNFAALDVVAHELTHGVTAATSGLIYLNESGALNEAFSDIIGAATEFEWQPVGPNLGQSDWLLGEDVRIGGGAIRSMSNPLAFGHPDHYDLRFTGSNDNGGVHINSGIANHAFYLAVVGGTHRTGATVHGVGLDLRHQIEQIYFRAFTGLLTRSATFAEARAATVQSARDLFGAGSLQEAAIIQSWNAVGVQ